MLPQLLEEDEDEGRVVAAAEEVKKAEEEASPFPPEPASSTARVLRVGDEKKSALPEEQAMIKRNRTGRAQPHCLPLIRYALFFMGFLVLVGGMLYICMALYIWGMRNDFTALLHSLKYTMCIYTSLGLGVLMLSTGVPFCHAHKGRTALGMYGVYLLLTALVLTGFSVLSLSYKEEAENIFSYTLRDDVVANYHTDLTIRRALDAAQIELRCCGAHRFDEYVEASIIYEGPLPTTPEYRNDFAARLPKRLIYPDSCCKTPAPNCSLISDGPSNIYYRGCITPLQEYFKEQMTFFCAMAIAFTIVAYATTGVVFLVLFISRVYGAKNGLFNEAEGRLFDPYSA